MGEAQPKATTDIEICNRYYQKSAEAIVLHRPMKEGLNVKVDETVKELI
jgi:hypothetical protein